MLGEVVNNGVRLENHGHTTGSALSCDITGPLLAFSLGRPCILAGSPNSVKPHLCGQQDPIGHFVSLAPAFSFPSASFSTYILRLKSRPGFTRRDNSRTF